MAESKPDDDAVLIEFLSSLMDYTPTIPDELAEYYLSKSGFQCPDVRIIRMVSIATQKFIAEIASDALQTLVHALAIYVQSNKQWDKYLRSRQHSYNRVTHSSVRHSLFEALALVSRMVPRVNQILQGSRLCKARQSAVNKEKRDKQQKDKSLVLTTEDLSLALREYGVNMKRQEYFADNPSAGTNPTSKDE